MSQKQLKNVIGDRFQFSIKNNLETSIRVALATANIDVQGIETIESAPAIDNGGAGYVSDGSGNSTAIRLHQHNIAGLVQAGHAVDVVLDDATVSVTVNGETGDVVMGCVDSSRSIQNVKRELARKPRWIKRITIAASSTTAYNTSMSVATLSAFCQAAEIDIDINQYFLTTQYQNDKVNIDFEFGELQWNADFLWLINIPADVREQITVEFYNE